MRMRKIHRTTKYTLVIIILLVLFNLAFGLILSKAALKAMRVQIDERMLDISNTAAAMINGDDLAQMTANDLGSPEYQRVMENLTYFQDNIELAYIYCIMQVGEREFVFGVDPTIEDPGEFGSPIVYTDALYNASKGKADVDDEPYEDDWGKFYSAYSPVYDSNGDVAGIVAVDFDAEWYQNRIKQLGTITGGFTALACIFSLCLSAIIATRFRKSFMHLYKKMNDLSDGIETLVHEVAPESETEDYTSLASIESKNGLGDAVDLLGDKINVMQARLARQIEVIRSHAYVDSLTGLNNRTSYEEYVNRLEKKLIDGLRISFSVVVFDINQLKAVNDTFGHEYGDMVIASVAKDISRFFEGHKIYRIGGDEFVCILEDVDPSGIIEKLREEVEKKNQESPILHDSSFSIGVSIGCATFDPAIDYGYMEVFNRADTAMYEDKRAFYQTHQDRRNKESEHK